MQTVAGGQFDWGGRLLKRNGGAQRFPQPGWKSGLKSVKAQGSLTVRHTSRTGTKVGLSDPPALNGKAGAQRTKATPGITGLSCPRVRSGSPPKRLGGELRLISVKPYTELELPVLLGNTEGRLLVVETLRVSASYVWNCREASKHALQASPVTTSRIREGWESRP